MNCAVTQRAVQVAAYRMQERGGSLPGEGLSHVGMSWQAAKCQPQENCGRVQCCNMPPEGVLQQIVLCRAALPLKQWANWELVVMLGAVCAMGFWEQQLAAQGVARHGGHTTPADTSLDS